MIDADELRAKRAENERLRSEVEFLRGHLQQILRWCSAYPETRFPEPDLKKAAEVLRGSGMTLDAISAHAMRHAVKGIGAMARCALEREDPQ